jgi:hypothetical protein
MLPAAASGALEIFVQINAKENAAAPIVLEGNVLRGARQKAAAIIASEMNALLIATMTLIAVNLQCIFHWEWNQAMRQPVCKWAKHATFTSTSISAKIATTQMFTKRPAFPPMGA